MLLGGRLQIGCERIRWRAVECRFSLEVRAGRDVRDRHNRCYWMLGWGTVAMNARCDLELFTSGISVSAGMETTVVNAYGRPESFTTGLTVPAGTDTPVMNGAHRPRIIHIRPNRPGWDRYAGCERFPCRRIVRIWHNRPARDRYARREWLPPLQPCTSVQTVPLRTKHQLQAASRAPIRVHL